MSDEVNEIDDVGGTYRARPFKVTERYVHGWTDWRAVYATEVTRWYIVRCWWRDTVKPWFRSVRRAYVRYRMRWTRTL